MNTLIVLDFMPFLLLWLPLFNTLLLAHFLTRLVHQNQGQPSSWRAPGHRYGKKLLHNPSNCPVKEVCRFFVAGHLTSILAILEHSKMDVSIRRMESWFPSLLSFYDIHTLHIRSLVALIAVFRIDNISQIFWFIYPHCKFCVCIECV